MPDLRDEIAAHGRFVLVLQGGGALGAYEYGVLKAVGTRNRTLYVVVATQAVITAGLGSALGIGLAYGASWIIVALRPEFLVAIEPQAVGWALLMGIVMALLGAILPARTISKLAPAEVFRG